MINQEELAICKRRGHNIQIGLQSGWVECPECGSWVREVVVLEEREDVPPPQEQNTLMRLSRKRDSN